MALHMPSTRNVQPPRRRPTNRSQTKENTMTTDDILTTIATTLGITTEEAAAMTWADLTKGQDRLMCDVIQAATELDDIHTEIARRMS
jgi:hypothetical protein